MVVNWSTDISEWLDEDWRADVFWITVEGKVTLTSNFRRLNRTKCSSFSFALLVLHHQYSCTTRDSTPPEVIFLLRSQETPGTFDHSPKSTGGRQGVFIDQTTYLLKGAGRRVRYRTSSSSSQQVINYFMTHCLHSSGQESKISAVGFMVLLIFTFHTYKVISSPNSLHLKMNLWNLAISSNKTILDHLNSPVMTYDYHFKDGQNMDNFLMIYDDDCSALCITDATCRLLNCSSRLRLRVFIVPNPIYYCRRRLRRCNHLDYYCCLFVIYDDIVISLNKIN